MTNINIQPQKIGVERRQEILDDISYKGTFLPKSVLEEDMDESLINFIKNDKRINFTIDGVKVPVIFLTIQRWSEFSQTWQTSDKFKNINIPFITIIRNPDIQQGTNQAGLWNIPTDRTYTYVKVPTFDGIRKGVDLYKIPQPTAVDVTYEIRLFTNRMKDLNRFNRKMQKAFKSKQCYINVNEHPMPLILETIGDESNIEDFENKRYYIQLFEIKLLGYILDEEDFEVIPTINRSVVMTELQTNNVVSNIVFTPEINLSQIVYTFVFKPNSTTEFSFINQYDVNLTQLTNLENIDRIIIKKNGSVIFDGLILLTPISLSANDTILIIVYKDSSNEGIFKLIGNTV